MTHVGVGVTRVRTLVMAAALFASAACGLDAAPAEGDRAQPAAETEPSELPRRDDRVPAVGVVTQEQANRRGADALADCQDRGAIFERVVVAQSAKVRRLYAGYRTDFEGLLEWGREMRGQALRGSPLPASANPDFLLCWASVQVEGQDQAGAVVLQVDLTGERPVEAALARAAGSIGVVAPPLPDAPGPQTRPVQPADVTVE